MLAPCDDLGLNWRALEPMVADGRDCGHAEDGAEAEGQHLVPNCSHFLHFLHPPISSSHANPPWFSENPVGP